LALLAGISLNPVYDSAGNRIFDPLLYVYNAGTLTPAATYYDAGFGNKQPSPVPGRSNGTLPVVYVQPATYRVRIIDQIEDLLIDAPSSGGGGGGGSVDPTAIAQTGDIKDRYSAGVHAGWVRMSGRNIGSTASGGTERANDDTHDLFVFLWTNDATLAVSGGRGQNAEADWQAGKTINLPDARGRLRVTVDNLAGSAANRMTGGTFTLGDPNTIGSVGGEAAHTLTIAELPSFTVPVTASMDAQGNHAHAGTTDGENVDHVHAIPITQVNVAVGTLPVTAVGGAGSTITGGRSVGHTHTFLTSVAGNHAHNITVNASPVGGGGAHNALPPFLLTASYIKL
jgi:hypothetical protein